MGDLSWLALVAVAAAVEAYARASRRCLALPWVATLGAWVAGLLERRSARWLALIGWAWLGWHLFARYTLR